MTWLWGLTWCLSGLILAVWILPNAWRELRSNNGVRRWKRLLFALSHFLLITAIARTLRFAGILTELDVDDNLVYTIAATSFLAAVVCIALMYRR